MGFAIPPAAKAAPFYCWNRSGEPLRHPETLLGLAPNWALAEAPNFRT